MEGEAIIAIYEVISDTTRQMLASAQAGDWDRLVDLEKSCSTSFARLFECEGRTVLSTECQHRKAALIRRVLDDDAQIRLLVEPWLADLTALIGNTRQQNRLSQAYKTGQ